MKKNLVKIIEGEIKGYKLLETINGVKDFFNTEYLVIEQNKYKTALYIEKKEYQKIYKVFGLE